MKGLEISVTNSDLVVKQEERLVKLFVIFKDKKYGTKYVIFTDSTNQLYYGNPLVNGKKMVIMKFRDIKDAEMVKDFVWKFLNGEQISNFDILEMPELDKLEIIDNNILEVKEEYLVKLLNIFFNENKEVVKETVLDSVTSPKKIQKKKSILPVLFTFVIIFGGIFGYMYLKNNPELIYGKSIYVDCKKNYINEELDSNVSEFVTLTFNNSQVLKKHEKDITYVFNDNDIYYNFKERNLSKNYIKDTGNEEFNDENLSYRLLVNYDLNNNYILPKGYDELFDYYNNNGYSCSIVEK